MMNDDALAADQQALDERLLYLETHRQQLIEVLSKHHKQTLDNLSELNVPRCAPE
jgi:hypothetical protein